MSIDFLSPYVSEECIDRCNARLANLSGVDRPFNSIGELRTSDGKEFLPELWLPCERFGEWGIEFHETTVTMRDDVLRPFIWASETATNDWSLHAAKLLALYSLAYRVNFHSSNDEDVKKSLDLQFKRFTHLIAGREIQETRIWDVSRRVLDLMSSLRPFIVTSIFQSALSEDVVYLLNRDVIDSIPTGRRAPLPEERIAMFILTFVLKPLRDWGKEVSWLEESGDFGRNVVKKLRYMG